MRHGSRRYYFTILYVKLNYRNFMKLILTASFLTKKTNQCHFKNNGACPTIKTKRLCKKHSEIMQL